MAISLWILIIIVYVIVKVSKAAGNSRVRGTQKKSAAQPIRNQQRSFAAMPKQQHQAVPNVESNCSADDKHRYENNLSKHNKKSASAIPNVPSSRSYRQPKMSGNRKAARQLYMGDPVPHGMKVIRCGYCAADNLVPYTARDSYKCYFCHYDI